MHLHEDKILSNTDKRIIITIQVIILYCLIFFYILATLILVLNLIFVIY